MKRSSHRYKGAKALIHHYFPDANAIRNNKHLKIFGPWLLNPNLWHLSRRSVANALSIALFVAYTPILGHMPLAALLAIFFRANMALSITLVWIANPFTIPPMYYFGYRIGAWILDKPLRTFHFEPTFQWFFSEMGAIYVPMLMGSLLCGVLLALFANIGVRLYWRYSVNKAWKARYKKTIGLARRHT